MLFPPSGKCPCLVSEAGGVSAVPRIISRTASDVDGTIQWCYHIVHSLPVSRDTILFRLRCWITTYAVCRILAPATRGTVQHHLCRLVLGVPSLLDPTTSLTLGPCARGEGISLLPFVCEHNDSIYGWQADPVIIA